MRALHRTMTTTTRAKHSLSALPLPSKSNLLIHNLTPDPATPSVSAFKKVLTETPSVQRRSRILPSDAHFSHVSPYTLPFPFRITPPETEEDEALSREAYVETWLARREAVEQRHVNDDNGLAMWYPKEGMRDEPVEFIGISETGLRDYLPQLDVGDAFQVLGVPELQSSAVEGEVDVHETEAIDKSGPGAKARKELVDILGGQALLVSKDGAEVPFGPWSLRYSGHQFGVWAGQLGDGRAISVLATPHPTEPDSVIELQLKGAGRTPFSRSADGLAVVRSSIREYLCAEAMHALNIPTTRSLSIVSLPSLPVLRERREYASIVTRMAPSFLRIGSFEALNPPARMFFLGGGQQERDLEALRILGEWVTFKILKLGARVEEGQGWGKELVLEVARRNARMVAAWQTYGFMHGVINTDNVSVLGLTIDYGPYAFMDVFDPMHICNHSDEEGRYSYKNQPAMILFALRALFNAISPLIGHELDHANARPGVGWAANLSDDEIKALGDKGRESLEKELEETFLEECNGEYGKRMRERLGLKTIDDSDEVSIVRPFLNLLQQNYLDFHSSFRLLCTFKPSHAADQKQVEEFVEKMLAFTSRPEMIIQDSARREWKEWLEKYAERVKKEKESWVVEPKANGHEVNGDLKTEDESGWEDKRKREMRGKNPRFVLRQWVLEEVIKKVEDDNKQGRKVLAKVMHMACNPYETWGDEDGEYSEDELDEEMKQERRVCGVGDNAMLGFQCSCSS